MARKRKSKEFDHIEIVDIAARGKCIGKTPEGEIVLVDGAIPGDIIRGDARRKKKGLWQVRAKEFITPSPYRIQPRCDHFGSCGGCKWQNLDMSQQLHFKEKQVLETMKRVGGVSNFEFKSIVPSPKLYAFRNKMEFSFSTHRWKTQDEVATSKSISKSGGLGLHPPGWFQKVVDLETCHLIPDNINRIRNFIRERSRQLELSFYDPLKHEGIMRNLIFRVNRKNEIMLVFIFGSTIPEAGRQLMVSTQQTFTNIVSIYSVVNEKVNDSIYDLYANKEFGEDYLSESIGDVNFTIGPKSFFQTNIYQTEQLYATVKSLARMTGNEIVYDLYSGIGSIALYVSAGARSIIAIEDVKEAVEDAKLNAELNGVEHIKYYTGKMEHLVQQNDLDALPRPDVVITDPPRAGMHKAVVQFILKQEPRRIVYVSCDPSTQARDVNLLSEKYKLVSLQPFDMFPHTSHIEAVALLEYTKNN